MAQLTPLDFIAKWQLRFQPNTTFEIDEADFQEFALDIADTFGVRVENVPEYVPGTTYAEKFLVRYTPANGQEAFYYALQAGKLPAPTGLVNDPNWKAVPGPVPATALSQFITLAQARNMNGDLVVLGRDYQIELPTPSAGGHAQYLSVAGIAENWFASEGWLVVNNVRTKVKNIDLVAITWEVDTRYTKVQTDTLLVTKQGAVTSKSRFTVYGPSATLPADRIDTLCLLATGGDTIIDLPVPTLTDVGKMLTIDHYSGSGDEATATYRILLPGSATFATPPPPQVLAASPRKYVAEFKCLLETRGTPYDDTIATWACTANSQAVPAAKADLVDGRVPTSQLPGFVRALYTVQPADVAKPAKALTLAVANALYFASVQVVGTPQLVYGSHYTSQAGQLTLDASVVASLQVGDLLRYSYQLGGGAAAAAPVADKFLTGSYLVQAGDVTSPASALGIAVAGALVFANVRVAGAANDLVYGSGYTSTPGVLVVDAGVSPALQAGQRVTYSYLPGTISPVSVATRSEHATSPGLLTTGGIKFQQAPAQLVASVIDNIAGLSAQVNYRDPLKDSVWIAGSIRSSTSSSAAGLAALCAQVMADIQAIPPAALAIAGELMLRTYPSDNTLTSSFFLDGLIPGRLEGRSQQFRVTYTGPPARNLFPNSQFQTTSQFWSVTQNWAYGNGQASIINGGPNGAGDALYCLLGVQAGTYDLTVGVLALNSLNMPFDIECPQGQPATQYFITAVGDTVFRITVPTGTLQLAFRGPCDVVLSHVYLVPVP